jgi:hypothetical protein
MSTEKKSQGLREPSADEGSVSATWDPYEVWLNRVKKPRDEQTATVQVVRIVDGELSDTARHRILTPLLSR